MDVWTKFEECRSRRYRVIDRKRKGYRRTYRQTDLHVQSNIVIHVGQTQEHTNMAA